MQPGSAPQHSRSRGSSSFAQFMQQRRSQSSAINTNGDNRNSSDTLPAITQSSGGEQSVPRRRQSARQTRKSSSERIVTMKTPQLLEYIEEQRAELQARTDSVNAIQRNFERLGEMYRVDRAELERLREEAQKWRGREKGADSERKVLTALREELEDLMQTHKRLKEEREREQEKFRVEREDAKRECETLQQRLSTQQALLTQSRHDSEKLAHTNNNLQREHDMLQSRLREVTDSTGELQQAHSDLEHTCEELRNSLHAQQAQYESLQEELQQKLQQEIQQRMRSEENFAERLRGLTEEGEAKVHRTAADLRAAAASVMRFAAEVQRRIVSALASRDAAARSRAELQRTISTDAAPRDIITSALDLVYDAVDAACGVVRGGAFGEVLTLLIAEFDQCEARLRVAFYEEETAKRNSLYVAAEAEKEKLYEHQRHEDQLKMEQDRYNRREAQFKIDQDEQKRREAHLKFKQEELKHREAHFRSEREEYIRLEAHLRAEQEEYKRREAHLKLKLSECHLRESQLNIEQEEHRRRESQLKMDQEEQHRREAQLKMEQDEHKLHKAQVRMEQDERKSRETQLKVEQGERNSIEAQLKAEQKEQHRREAQHAREKQMECFLCETQSLVLREEHERTQCEAHERDVREAYAHERALASMCSLSEACAAKSHTNHVQELVATQRRELRAAHALAESMLSVAGAESSARASLLCDWASSLSHCFAGLGGLRDAAWGARLEAAAREAEALESRAREAEAAARLGPLGSAAALAAAQRLVDAEAACESAYSCGLCFALYKRPVTCAPCGHTFCEGCLLDHPQNLAAAAAARKTGIVRYCPECRFSACNSVVRVPALQRLSGNFEFRERAVAELTRIIAGLVGKNEK